MSMSSARSFPSVGAIESDAPRKAPSFLFSSGLVGEAWGCSSDSKITSAGLSFTMDSVLPSAPAECCCMSGRIRCTGGAAHLSKHQGAVGALSSVCCSGLSPPAPQPQFKIGWDEGLNERYLDDFFFFIVFCTRAHSGRFKEDKVAHSLLPFTFYQHFPDRTMKCSQIGLKKPQQPPLPPSCHSEWLLVWLCV